MNYALLSVRGVTKMLAQHKALTDVSLEVKHGEFIAVLGPSGCGKTTLLRCIAGFVSPDTGSIWIGGEDVTHRPPNRRPLNTVFQNYALFPHMCVLDNVAYGPRRRGVPRREAQESARDALDLVGLGRFGGRYPQQLSGGQQQRVALARALVNRPKLLLLDEPLSALDLKLRKRMQIELKHLQQKLGISFVFVTHDQEEAMTMADRVVVMNGGHIEQVGTGGEIYRAPRTRFVADFIGDANFIVCLPVGEGALKPAIGSRNVPYNCQMPAARLTAVLRPEHVEILKGPVPDLSIASGVVEDVIDIGIHTTVMVKVGEQTVVSRRIDTSLRPVRGDTVIVGFRPLDVHVVAE